jgi:hypothetical protein
MLYKLKSALRRSAFFAAAVAMLGSGVGAVLPHMASADALNPLTERTLLLSSSSPGYHYFDGAGNTGTGAYAPPNSGPNGQKTGETFTFKTSSNSGANAVKAFTFQYCTTAAGNCLAPGNDTGNAFSGGTRAADTTSTSDLNVVTSSPAEISSGDWTTISASGSQVPAQNNSQGNFVVLKAGVYDPNWTMSATNLEDNTTTATGKNNLITLKNTSGITTTAGQQYKVVFFGTDTNYITNPGADAFFVKINDYSNVNFQNFRDAYPTATNICNSDHVTYNASGTDTCNQNVIDGGVTVANIMTDSIQIQTKVLETMSFSVGTVNPDNVPTGGGSHGPCDAIAVNNAISLGDDQAEFSLKTGTAYDGDSYWRLSSNSSNGATVYYSGYTLSNTEGDQIAPIGTNSDKTPLTGLAGDGTAQNSHPGTEQFGLALDASASTDTLDTGAGDQTHAHLLPLIASTTAGAHVIGTVNDYGDGAGSINGGSPNSALFAFNKNANTVPQAIAAENTDVVSCATGKMRYLANIAATTPAGIYSTKINYLAAPEY